MIIIHDLYCDQSVLGISLCGESGETGHLTVILLPAQDDNTVDLGLKKTPQSGGTSFNSLCSQLPSRVSTAMAKNVSVSICFVCLLHLANEKVQVLSLQSN